jgi:hypothetical protein
MPARFGIDSTPSRVLSIPDGAAGIARTLEIMAGVVGEYRVDVSLRELATDVVRDCPGKDESCEVEAVQAYVRNTVRYQKDVNDVETIQTPDYTLKLGAGDCDDQSILVAALLECLGYPCGFEAIGPEAGDFRHVYAIVQLDGRWQSVETTEDWPVGYVPPAASRMRQLVEGTGMKLAKAKLTMGGMVNPDNIFAPLQVGNMVGACLSPDGSPDWGCVDYRQDWRNLTIALQSGGWTPDQADSNFGPNTYNRSVAPGTWPNIAYPDTAALRTAIAAQGIDTGGVAYPMRYTDGQGYVREVAFSGAPPAYVTDGHGNAVKATPDNIFAPLIPTPVTTPVALPVATGTTTSSTGTTSATGTVTPSANTAPATGTATPSAGTPSATASIVTSPYYYDAVEFVRKAYPLEAAGSASWSDTLAKVISNFETGAVDRTRAMAYAQSVGQAAVNALQTLFDRADGNPHLPTGALPSIALPNTIAGIKPVYLLAGVAAAFILLRR